MNTPTPRTDAQEWTETNRANAVVLASFARELERELAREREKVRVLRSALEKLYADTIYHHDYVDYALDATEDKP